MLLIGTMDVGQLLWTRAALQDAVVRAARYIGGDAQDMRQSGRNRHICARFGDKSALGDVEFTLQHGFCGVQVRARLGYHALVPFFGWLAPELEATACVP